MKFLKRLISGIHEFLLTMVIIFFLPIYHSIKYIFKDENPLKRILIFIGYIGLIASSVLWISVRYIMLAMYLIFSIVSTIAYFLFNKTNRGMTNISNSYFDGMNSLDARNEYQRLLDIYNSDNGGEEEIIVKRIMAAYGDYCIRNHN